MSHDAVTPQFQELIDAGNPVGEVIAVDKFFIKIKGLHPISVQSLVMFEDGSQGFVRYVNEDHVAVFYMGTDSPSVGTVAVLYRSELMTNVGEELIGRIITPMGVPLDGKGPLRTTTQWPIFKDAPAIHEREMLSDLLESGVTIIDSLFPAVRGQRLAIIGDMKVGKTSLATQLAINQKDADSVTVYALIAKRQSDIDELVSLLKKNDAMRNAIVIISTIFDSLVTSYLVPYIACAIGEYLWQEKDRDVVAIYDDLTTHAQIYREISLISGANPGRDSYPGDIFYIHSSLLERAGRLHRNHKTFTALPLVLAAGGDITAYLPTNIISITDGQWILDKEVFRDGLRPAVSSSLSVTRVGGRGHSARQKAVAARTLRALSSYNQALEFSHFGAELADATLNDLRVGRLLKAAMSQLPGERYDMVAQQLMLELIIDSAPEAKLDDIAELKAQVLILAAKVRTDEDFEQALTHLKKHFHSTSAA